MYALEFFTESLRSYIIQVDKQVVVEGKKVVVYSECFPHIKTAGTCIEDTIQRYEDKIKSFTDNEILHFF